MALSVTVHGITIKTGTQTSGRLATADITTQDGLDNVLYTVSQAPDMDYAIVAISVCNRESAAAEKISLAVCDSDIPKDVDFIEWNTTLVPNGVLERTQLSIQAGQRVVLRWGDSPLELVTESEMLTTVSYSFSATGTGSFDISTPDQVSFTLAEGDTGQIITDTFALVEGNTYRAAVSFLSTDATGTGPSIEMTGNNGSSDIAVVTLGLEDTNRVDDYRTYYADFTVDNLTDFNDQISQFKLNLADVNATVDRISLKQIA
jgi:hypothetical protein